MQYSVGWFFFFFEQSLLGLAVVACLSPPDDITPLRGGPTTLAAK